ncbi:DnaJ-like protein [Stygiomarasmius scandens]|uniref:DnaJ-like protein n=1 Tax=Marasmiellus scandens TaxID=2682957 RepID=A0ABR1JQG6_9AGAR
MSNQPIPSRPLVPHIPTSCSSCSVPLEFPVPSPPPSAGTLLYVRCWSCQSTINHAFYPTQVPAHYSSIINRNSPGLNANSYGGTSGGAGSSSNASSGRKGRKIGTQERPLETAYYDLLGVPVTATTDDIKKAYRRLAIKHHPDKNPDDPQAEERFKAIAIAYQTLSDPALRAKYNEFGPKESAPEGGYVDPEEVFSAIFGGERFIPIIGQISLARDMKTALQEAEDAEDEGGDGKKIKDKNMSEEEKAKKAEKDKQKAAERAAARAERVNKLVENLERKLGIFTESATGVNDRDVTQSFRTICELEAEDLARESYGPELLQAIGFVYVSKAKHLLASNQTFLGVGGWLHNVQGKYHVFSETVSTLRAAIELKAVFDQIQAAEKAGNLSPEEKQKLEESAAEKGLQALFKGAKLEIESVLREVCDRLLEDASIPREKIHLRAVGLQILGEAYMNVKKEGSSAQTPPATSGLFGGQRPASPGGAKASSGPKRASRGVWDDSDYVRVDTKNSRARESR